jgi:hypothetical protein
MSTDRPCSLTDPDLRRNIRALNLDAEVIKQAFVRSDLDICPCMRCDLPVICIPDGLPMCPECAAKEGKS